MKLRKTHQSKRKSYTYEFSNGETLALKAGENGVTEEDIKVLNDLDDQEVYYNNKNLKPKLTPAEKQQLKEWEEKQDWRMFDKNWTVSLDACTEEDESGDKNIIWKKIYEIEAQNQIDSQIELLQELIEKLSHEQQWFIQKVYFENMTLAEVAKVKNISTVAVHYRLKVIHKKIKKIWKET